MPEPVLNQLSAFFLFFLGGIAIGLAFDMLRILRASLRPHKAAAFLLDIIFWLEALCIVFPLLIMGTWGEPRLFVWLALCLGFAYYFLLLGRYLRPLLRILLGAIIACLLFARRRWSSDALLRAESGIRPGKRERRRGNPRP